MAVTIYAEGQKSLANLGETKNLSAATETTLGVYQLMIDVTPIVANETLYIWIKEEAYSGGTQREIIATTVAGSVSHPEPVWVSPALMLGNGWNMSVKQTGGTARTIDWSIRKA